MKLIYLPLCLSVMMLCGCDKDAQSADAREERNPLIKTGQEYMNAKSYGQAEAVFKQALDKDPQLAQAHWDLALIYQQYRVNYIYAIYHYDRYLELRPDSEKKELINEQKIKVAQQLAEVLIRNSPEVQQLVTEAQQLRRENAELKQQIATSKKTTPPPAVVATGSTPKSSDAQAAAPTENSGHQIYTVVAGDTLSKIAKKYYGNTDWDVIYDANKDRMRGPGDLRIGQTLVIPNR